MRVLVGQEPLDPPLDVHRWMSLEATRDQSVTPQPLGGEPPRGLGVGRDDLGLLFSGMRRSSKSSMSVDRGSGVHLRAAFLVGVKCSADVIGGGSPAPVEVLDRCSPGCDCP